MSAILALWFKENKAHVIYVCIILVIGVVTNYLFSRYKLEHDSRVRWEKVAEFRKNNVKTVKRVVTKEIPVYMGEKVVYVKIQEENTSTEDLSQSGATSESRTAETVQVQAGHTPVFTVSAMVKAAEKPDVLVPATLRLYGPLGLGVAVASENNFTGFAGYVGVSYTP